MFRPLLVLALVFGVAAMAAAGENSEIAIALHVQDHYDECLDLPVVPDCWAIQTYWAGTGEPIYIYVLVCGHGWTASDGFQGASYGLTWPPEWGFGSWESCADLATGIIEHPGDGVDQVWASCLPPLGWAYTAGILQLFPTSPGYVEVVVHPVTGTAEVLDCWGAVDLVLPCVQGGNGRAGWVSVGLADGCNPCPCVGPPCILPSATESDSWGAIKNLFK